MTNGTRPEWGVSVTRRPLFTPEKDPVPIVQQAGWAPRPVWTGAKNLAPTGIRFPDCPVRSQSLRSTLPGPQIYLRPFTKSRLQICEGFWRFMDFLGVFQNFLFRKELIRSFCATSMHNLLLLLQLFLPVLLLDSAFLCCHFNKQKLLLSLLSQSSLSSFYHL